MDTLVIVTFSISSLERNGFFISHHVVRIGGEKSSNFGGISNKTFFPPGPRKLHYKFRRYLNFFFFPPILTKRIKTFQHHPRHDFDSY